MDLPLTPEEKKKLGSLASSPPKSVGARRVESVNTIDGIKLILDGGSWILIRESGTEPLARVYVEGKSDEEVASLARAARELVAV